VPGATTCAEGAGRICDTPRLDHVAFRFTIDLLRRIRFLPRMRLNPVFRSS
jgi:hypothetical protein